MIFLGFLVVHTWQHEKAKLFGWLKISTILMLFIFYLFQSIIKFSDTGDCKRGTIKPFDQGNLLKGSDNCLCVALKGVRLFFIVST